MEHPMQKFDDLSRSLTTLEPGGTLIAVIEMSLSSWLVAGIVPGVERQRLKKLAIDESALLKLYRLFKRGEPWAICAAALATGPQTTKELALALMRAKGMDLGDTV